MYYRNRNVLLFIFLALAVIGLQSFIFYKLARVMILDKFSSMYIYQVDPSSSNLYLLDFTNANENSNNVVRVDMLMDNEALNDLSLSHSDEDNLRVDDLQKFKQNEALNSKNTTTYC